MHESQHLPLADTLPPSPPPPYCLLPNPFTFYGCCQYMNRGKADFTVKMDNSEARYSTCIMHKSCIYSRILNLYSRVYLPILENQRK